VDSFEQQFYRASPGRQPPRSAASDLHRFLEATVPFHIAFDRGLRVTQFGRSIGLLCPKLAAGQPLQLHLALEQPAAALTIGALEQQLGSPVLFQTRAKQAILRGEIVQLAGGAELCFVGSPRVTDISELEVLGLTAADFAASDPVLDYIVAHDVASARRHEDRLTGLGNRTLFYAQSQRALARQDGRGQVAALLIDIDDFRLTNDGLGHNCGDELLIATARRLAACVRPGDTIARLGGDEFAILLEGAGASRARAIAKRLVRALSRPVQVREHDIPVTVSVGIAIAAPTDGVDELLRKADVAMYRAKAAGKCRFANYRARRDVSLSRLEVETELRRALDNDDLRVFYQPIVGLKTRSLIGFEALVRWDHPERGMVTPADFIPLAEQSNLIIQIGERVLAGACRQASDWRRTAACDGSPTVSVNVSSRQLTDPTLVRNVERILAETGLDPRLLVLEITETALMSGTEHALGILQRLHQIGLGIALDDFGTGYSSLSHLQQFPVDAIKIDKSFVDGITDGGQAAAFARVVIQLASIVGVESVAEGVERADQLHVLAALECDRAQGHLFGPPLPADEATALVDSRRLVAAR
jgi:diguanylate cyclase (GGDEF)-like protein